MFPCLFKDKNLGNFSFKKREELREEVCDFVRQSVWRGKKGVAFFGAPGVGKTHLLIGLSKALMDISGCGRNGVQFFVWTDLLKECREEVIVDASGVDTLLEEVCRARFLCLDDVTTEVIPGQFGFKIFERLMLLAYDREVQVIMTLNWDREIEEFLQRFNEHLVDRLLETIHFAKIGGDSWRIKR